MDWPPLRPEAPYARAEMRNWIRHIDALIGNLIVFNWRHHLQKVAEKWTDAELAEKMKSIPSKERQEAIALSRDMNEYGARMTSDHKGRFGLFAVLPLPDIDASLREIEYAFDTLKADGVGLLTSYGTIWLGDPTLHPVFEELNRRSAVVYTHPEIASVGKTITLVKFPS